MIKWIKNILVIISILIFNTSAIYAIVFNLDSATSGEGTRNFTQTLSGETLKITGSNDDFWKITTYNQTPLNGIDSVIGAGDNGEILYTFTLVSGNSFNLDSIKIKDNYFSEDEPLIFSSSKGDILYTVANGASQSFDVSSNPNASFMQGITSFTIAPNGGDGILQLIFDDIVLTAPVTTKPEPTNYPTSFVATADSTSQITTAWTDSLAGSQVPDGYLVMCATTNSFSDPVDTTAQSDDSSCADGSGVQNITHGTQTVAWTGLSAGTQYYYKIFPYTNSGGDIDYKTDGTVETDNATTQSLQDTDSTLTASSTIDESSMIAIPTTANTLAQKVDVFDFTLADPGTSDGLTTDITNLVLHTSGTADFSKMKWLLNGADASDVVGVYNSSANTVTFSTLSISVADGASETYTLSGYFTNVTTLTDNATFGFSIDGDTDVTVNSAKSGMATGQSTITNVTNAKVDVIATKLIFTTQPAPISIEKDVEMDFTTDPVVKAVDANGNIDTDFTESVTLSSVDGAFTNGTITATNGVATFTGLKLTSSSSSSSIKIIADDDNGVGTDLSTVESSEITITNQAPTVSGAEADQAVNDNVTIKPFANIILGDGDGDNISVTISLNNDDYGTLSASTVSSGTVASVQATLRDITFTPASNRVAVGSTETTGLTITLNDGESSSIPNSVTTVVSTSVNDTPTDIALSNSSVAQSTGANAQIGTISSTDVDESDTFTYALVGGTGDTDNSSFNINGTNLRANNSNTLGAGTYSVRIQTTDASSATYAKEFTITITDDIKPTISTLSPADDATAVAVDSNLVITLSKDVGVDSGNIVIKKASDDATVETISATTIPVSINGAVITINPDTTLDFNTGYYIQIDNTAFKDNSNNYFAGISDKTTWSFTTGDAFSISKTTASVTEAGTTDSFTVVLNSQPTDNVVFTMASADIDEATVSTDTLTFTNSNWDTAQTVTLTGVDDSIFDGSKDTTITISVDDAQSDDAFDATANKTVTVTTADNDSVGITLDKSSLTLAENGGSDTFTITLNTIPINDVTVPLTTTPNCTLSTASVVLDSTAGVEVTVTAVDDLIDNATDRACTINSGDPTSADSSYGDLVATDVANVSVTLTDDDTVGFTLSKTTASVTEAGSTDSFSVVLNSQPPFLDAVTFDIVSDNTNEATVDLATLTFTSSNWHIAQIVTITGVDDSNVDGNQNSTITVSVNSSSHDTFDSLANKTVTVTTTDDDTAPTVTPPSTGGGSTGGGSTYTPPTTPTPEPEPEEEETVEPIVEEEKVVVQPITEPIVTPIVVERQTGNAEQTGTKPELDNVTKLYIATFGRAPESAGSVYWLYESKLNLEDIARSFFDQEETKEKYPEGYSNYDFIVSTYNHVYDRDPDQEGGDYWLEELDSGKVEKGLFILAVINGAIGDDALMLEKQTIAGVNFVKSGVQNLDMAKKVIDDIQR